MATAPDPQGSPLDPSVQIHINSQSDLRHFLKTIHDDFLRVVNPRECGLLDIMMQADLLTDTDYESLSGKDVYIRKDQARKLWFRLNKMSVADFMSEVFPKLCVEYGHIIPRQFSAEGQISHVRGYCLRHDIMGRVRPETMAETLFNSDCLSFEEYERVSEGQCSHEVAWSSLFEACCQPADDVAGPLLEGLQRLLTRYKLHVPADLADLVSRGLQCTCAVQRDSAPPGGDTGSKQQQIESWVRGSRGRVKPRADTASVTTVENASSGYPDDDQQSAEMDIDGPDTPDASGLKMWAKRHGLSNETSRVLIQQGFTSVDDLSLLTAEEVTESFQKRYLLPLKQCLLLKKAVAGSTSAEAQPLCGDRMEQKGVVEGRELETTDAENRSAEETEVKKLETDNQAVMERQEEGKATIAITNDGVAMTGAHDKGVAMTGMNEEGVAMIRTPEEEWSALLRMQREGDVTIEDDEIRRQQWEGQGQWQRMEQSLVDREEMEGREEEQERMRKEALRSMKKREKENLKKSLQNVLGLQVEKWIGGQLKKK